MRQIKQLCVLRQFDHIPDEIRKMKRLWQTGKAAVSLQKRRDLEAALFGVIGLVQLIPAPPTTVNGAQYSG